MPFFTWSSLLLIPPLSSLLQATFPNLPSERHWSCSNAEVTVLGKPKGVYASTVPLGIAFTKETHRQ